MFDLWDVLRQRAARKAPQPAAEARPNRPELHMNADAPAVMRGIEQLGEEYDGVELGDRPLPNSARNFRAGTGYVVDVSGDVALSDDRGTAADEHIGRGRPDSRRTGAALAGDASAPPAPIGPELRSNTRSDVVRHEQAPPARARQGFTGADPTRDAEMQVAFTVRPFDKAIADHPPLIGEKAAQAAPTASRPPERKRLAGARPSPLGGGPTGMLPVDGHKNTIRQTPGAWDASLVERTTADSAAASAQRQKGWRA